MISILAPAPATLASTMGRELRQVAELGGGLAWRVPGDIKGALGSDEYIVCTNRTHADLHFECEELGVDEFEPQLRSDLLIRFRRAGFRHLLGLRHSIPTRECRRMVREIHALLRGTRMFCVRGNPSTSDEIIDGDIRVDWVFDEIFTARGTVCEFNGCEERQTGPDAKFMKGIVSRGFPLPRE